MKIMISGGTKGIKAKEVNTFDKDNENFQETVPAMKVKTYRSTAGTKSVNLSGLERGVSSENFVVKTNKTTNVEAPKTPKVEKYTEAVVEKSARVTEIPVAPKVIESVEEVRTEAKETSTPVVEKIPYKDKKLSVNGVSTRQAKSPFTISEENREEAKAIEKSIVETGSPMVEIENAIKKIKSNFAKLDIDPCKLDTVKKFVDLITELMFTDDITLSDEDIDNAVEYMKEKFEEFFVKVMWNSEFEDAKTEYAEEEIEKLGCSCGESDEAEESAADDEYNDFNNVQFYNAKTVNLKDLIPDGQNRKVVVLLDSDNHYVFSDEESILAVDVIDDNIVDNVEIVSKTFLNNLIDTLEKKNTEVSDEDTEEEDSAEESTNSVPETTEETSTDDINNATKEFLTTEFGGSNKVEV